MARVPASSVLVLEIQDRAAAVRTPLEIRHLVDQAPSPKTRTVERQIHGELDSASMSGEPAVAKLSCKGKATAVPRVENIPS